MPSDPLKGLEILQKISRIVEDTPLPKSSRTAIDKNGLEVGVGVDGEGNPITPDKLLVSDVLGPDSPFRVTDAETGLSFIDDSKLHITDMDLEDTRKELGARIDKATELQATLNKLGSIIDKKVRAAGGVDVRVDTKKNVNLRRAIARLYGKKTNIITFDMYKQALDLRQKLRKQELEATLKKEMGEPPCPKLKKKEEE